MDYLVWIFIFIAIASPVIWVGARKKKEDD